MDKLQACPFCGGEAEVTYGRYSTGEPWKYIACPFCEGMAEPDMWNKRPLEIGIREQLTRVISRLRSTLEFYANENTYRGNDDEGIPAALVDCGGRAKQALEDSLRFVEDLHE